MIACLIFASGSAFAALSAARAHEADDENDARGACPAAKTGVRQPDSWAHPPRPPALKDKQLESFIPGTFRRPRRAFRRSVLDLSKAE